MRHQLPQRQEAHQRRHGVGEHQDDHFDPAARIDDQVMQHPQRSAGQRQPDSERDQPAGVVLQRPTATADAEGEPAVRGRIGHRRHHQRNEVGRLSSAHLAQPEVEREVRKRAEHTDAAEADQLAEEAPRHPGNGGRDVGVAVQLGPKSGHRDAARGEALDQADHAGQVLPRGGDDVDPAVIWGARFPGQVSCRAAQRLEVRSYTWALPTVTAVKFSLTQVAICEAELDSPPRPPRSPPAR